MIVCDSIIADLQRRLPARRFQHTLGVLHTATQLAQSHGGDLQKISMAALLHDCAKGLDRTELEQMASEGKFTISELDREFPALWHGPAGAWIARSDYAVQDKEILEAIENHTLGRPAPSLTLRIVMAADTTEPMRDFEGLEPLREAVQKDLRSGLIAVLKEKVAHVNSKGRKPHPRIFETLASLEAE